MINLEPLPMQEAIDFWADKVQLSPGQFRKLADAAKVHAFSVAGIAKGAELESVFNALQRSIANGTTYEQFKDDIADTIKKRGWVGPRARRVDNIFRTNIQTAYSVGRYRQMMEAVATRPFWRYSAVNDGNTRPTHLAQAGKVYPADHPFWDSWYPPNGYRCRCGVTSLSADDIERDGIKVETDDPTGKLIEPIQPGTGRKLPARLMMPDRGFAHHPGKEVWGGVIDASDKPGKWLDIKSGRLPTAALLKRRKLGNVRPAEILDWDESKLLAAGLADAEYIAAFEKLYGKEMVLTDAAGSPVILSLRSFLVDKTPGAAAAWKFTKEGHGEIIPLLGDMVARPFEIWLTPQVNEAGRVRLARRYISLWKTADKKRIGGMSVFEVAGGVFQGVTAFVPFDKKGKPNIDYLERQRVGLLLYGSGQ